MLFPGFGVRPQSPRSTEDFGVLCVRLAPSQPNTDGPANALTGSIGSLDPAKAVVLAGSKDTTSTAASPLECGTPEGTHQ